MPGGIEGNPQDDPLKKYTPPTPDPDPSPTTTTTTTSYTAPNNNQTIMDRARGFSIYSIFRKPTVAAWAISQSQIAPHKAARFSYDLEAGVTWQDQLTTFDGQPGALQHAYDVSSVITDPGVSKASDEILNRLRSMSPEMQAQVAPYLNGITHFTGQNDAIGIEAFQMLMGDSTDLHHGWFGTTNTIVLEPSTPVNKVAALRSMFPNLIVEVDEQELGDVIAIGVGEEYRHIAKNSPTLRAFFKAYNDFDAGEEVGVWDLAKKTMFLPWTATSDIAHMLGRDTSNIAYSHGYPEFGSFIDQSFETYDAAMEGIGKAVEAGAAIGLGSPNESDPDYNPNYYEDLENRTAIIGIGAILGGITIGHVGRKIKTARTASSKTQAAVRLADQSAPFNPRRGPIGVAAEAYRKPLRYLSALENEKLWIKFAREPEKWLTTREGKKLLNSVDKARALYPGDFDRQVAWVYATYKERGLSIQGAKHLVRPQSRFGAAKAYVDLADSAKDPRKYVRGLRDAASDLKKTDKRISQVGKIPVGARDKLAAELDDLVRHKVEGEEIGLERTTLTNPDGTAKIFYHGTKHIYDEVDETLFDPTAAAGPGYYATDLPDPIASGYAGALTRQFPDLASAEDTAKFWRATGFTVEVREVSPGTWRVTKFDPDSNIRPVKMAMERPFDMDTTVPITQVAKIFKAAKLWMTAESRDWQLGDRAVTPDGAEGRIAAIDADGGMEIQTPTSSLYYADPRDLTRPNTLDRVLSNAKDGIKGWDVYGYLTDEFGSKAASNRFLEEIGYDGITHIGGGGHTANGGPVHNVAVAFHGHQVFQGVPTPTMERINSVAKQIEKIDNSPDGYMFDTSSLQELARLRIQKYILQQKIDSDYSHNPLFKVPNQSAIHNVVNGIPRSALQRIAYFMTDKAHFNEGKFFDPKKLIDDVPPRPKVFVPGSRERFRTVPGPKNRSPKRVKVEGYPLDGLEQNIEVLSTEMRRAGIRSSVIRLRMAELSNIHTPTEFYQFIEHKIFGEDGDFDHALQRQGVNDDLRHAIIRLHDTPYDARTKSWIYGKADTPAGVADTQTAVLARRLPDGSTSPTPSRPTEFLNNEIHLPSIDSLIEANSVIRRTMHRLGQKGFVGKSIRAVIWDMPRGLMQWSTAIQKPLVLSTRSIAMASRIQLEQGFRNTAYGYRPFYMPKGISLLPGGVPIPFTNHRLLHGLFGDEGWTLLSPDPKAEGMSLGFENTEVGMFDELRNRETHAVPMLEDMGKINARKKKPHNRHFDAVGKEIQQVQLDWLDARIIRNNFDVDRTLRSLEGAPEGTESYRYYREDMVPTLEDPELTINTNGNLHDTSRQWIQNRVDYLDQLTQKNPRILDWIKKREDAGFQTETSIVASLRYHGAATRLKEINAELKRLRTGKKKPSESIIRALEEDKVFYRGQRATLREDFPQLRGSRPGGPHEPHVDMGDILRQEFGADNWKFPQKISTRKMFANESERGDFLGSINRVVDHTSTAFYQGLRPVSWVDKKGTRGSLFAQAFVRETDLLKKLHYSPEDALALAYVRAARATRDMLYDLNAKSSFHRAVKDIFWFAPATQEVLTTWLFKIPSESYWALGAAKLAGEGVALIAALEHFGVISKGEKGERVIQMPPALQRIIDGALPGHLPEGAYVYGKLTGLNIALQGYPSLSGGASFVLGKTALEFGGPFKWLSDRMQPFGPESPFLPTSVIQFWEIATGSPPPWELFAPALVEDQFYRAKDEAVQFAYSELYHAGVKAPRPEDFLTTTGNLGVESTTLSPEGEAAFKAAQKDYLQELLLRADDLYRGIGFMRLLGMSAAPMSLYVGTKEKAQWSKFWKDVVGEAGTSGYTEEQHALIDGYFNKNPASVAYAVYTTRYQDATKQLPFPESPDDAIYDAWFRGEASHFTPEDYSLILAGSESQRHYGAQLQQALKAISPTLDPWELLSEGYKKQVALERYKADYDRYLQLSDPKLEGMLESQRQHFLEHYDLPIQTYEYQRIANTLHGLRQLSGQLTGENGIRPEEIRRTMGILAAELSKEGQYGEPRTPSTKALAWWFDTVLDPYIKKTEPLYLAAQEATSNGLDAGVYYDQIRQIENESHYTYEGKPVPGIEKFFFGNKTKAEQEAAVNTWRGRPLTWLSEFQLKKAGYDTSPSDVKFLEELNRRNEAFYDFIDKNDISSNSNLYDDEVKIRDAWFASLAQDYGKSAEHLLYLNQSAPYVRLTDTGFGSSSNEWGHAIASAQSATSAIIGRELSVKGFGEDALPVKAWFYGRINSMRDTSEEFDEMLNTLAESFPTDQGYPMSGAILYEAVFFGNFNTDYIPEELAQIGAR